MLGLTLVAVVICLLLYRSCSSSGLDIDPHAAKEIEKAKRR